MIEYEYISLIIFWMFAEKIAEHEMKKENRYLQWENIIIEYYIENMYAYFCRKSPIANIENVLWTVKYWYVLKLNGNIYLRRHHHKWKSVVLYKDTLTTANRIRNPGYHPTYLYGLACLRFTDSLMQKWLFHGCCPGLL